MSKSALVIGVDRTGGLPPLSGAASGARDFADWAEGQGLSVTLITDENGQQVRISDLQSATNDILSNNCEKLIVYFSGHGFLLSPQTELWLLSEAPDLGQEAVNVRLSIDNARYSGIDHVIFVSDACRSGGPTHQHRSMSGASLLRIPKVYDFNGKVDRFYAARPGDVALEYKTPDEAVSNSKGIFTECLINALKGKIPDVVTQHQQQHLILSEKLGSHLQQTVPIKATDISIRLNQKPIAISESHLPLFFGELSAPPTMADPDADQPILPEGDIRLMATTAREGVSDIPINDGPAPEPPSSDEDAAFDNQVNRIVSARGRDRFETETGFTVFGDVDQVTIANGWKTETFEDNDAMHIRVYPPSPESTCSILIQFEQGFGTVLAVKPGFIGSVIVEDEKVISVNYTPSLGSKLYDEQYRHMADSIEEQRAFAATATRHGVLEFNKEGASDAASYLRSIKGKDPSLGIYACYAYQQAGQIEEIRSVARYMEDDGAVFFDVLLLARLGEPWPTFAPFCPMLRQGWAMLELHPPSLERLEKYRSHLQPSLWTGFTPEGADLIRNDLESGELQ